MRENGVATLGWKCTLSLDGPLIIYPYWTQFTLKLTGSRLVSLAKLTSKLTIYDRSSVGSLAHSLTHSFIRSFIRSLACSLVSFFAFWLFSGRAASGSVTRRIHQNAIAFAIVADEREIYDARWIFINSSRISNPRSVLYLKFAAIPTSRTCLDVIYFYETSLIETFVPEIFRSNANPALVLYMWERCVF